MSQKKNTRQYQDEFIRLYQEEELSVSEIARRLGLNKNSVNRLLKEKIELRPSKISPEMLKQIKACYDEGMSKAAITRRFNLGAGHVTQLLYKHFNIEPRPAHRPLDQWKDEIIERYQKGESSPQIAAALGISVQGVCNVLERNHVQKRTYDETSRRYWLDDGYFQQLSPEKSYLLGVLYAIGRIHEGLDMFMDLSTTKKHQKIVEALIEPLTEVNDRRWRQNTNENSVSLRIPSTYLCCWLLNVGFPHVPPTLPDLDKQMFWRGYLLFRTSLKPTINKREKPRLKINFIESSLRQHFVDYHEAQFSCSSCFEFYSLRHLIVKDASIERQLLKLYPGLTDLWETF